MTHVSEVFLERPAIERAVQRAGEANNAISGHMSRTLGEIQGLSGSGLSGAANAALQQASVDIDQGFRKVLGALEDMAGQLRSALNRIESQDQSAATAISSATQDLTGATAPSAPITSALTTPSP